MKIKFSTNLPSRFHEQGTKKDLRFTQAHNFQTIFNRFQQVRPLTKAYMISFISSETFPEMNKSQTCTF